MTTPRRIPSHPGGILVLLLLFPMAQACDDDPTGPTEESGLAFSYTGDRAGEYATEGLPSVGASNLPESSLWAIAHPDSVGGLVILGFEPESGETGTLFILQLHPIRTGHWGSCQSGGGPDGCHGRLIMGVDPENPASVGTWFEITEGSVDLTQAGNGRVTGTFDAVFTSQDATETLSVTNGVIDVPLSADPLVGLSMACVLKNLLDGTSNPC